MCGSCKGKCYGATHYFYIDCGNQHICLLVHSKTVRAGIKFQCLTKVLSFAFSSIEKCLIMCVYC